MISFYWCQALLFSVASKSNCPFILCKGSSKAGSLWDPPHLIVGSLTLVITITMDLVLGQAYERTPSTSALILLYLFPCQS